MATRYIHFTEEQKQAARQIDIAGLLHSQGETLKRSGSEYEWRDGSAKVTVRGNLWYHQYEEVGGDAIDFVRRYSEVCKGFTYFAENDVLFAKITPCMENGKGGVAKGLKNGAGFGSTEFHVLRPIKGASDPYWLYIITMFPKFRSDAEKVMTGTGGQRRVPITYLSEYRIALPPIELQEQFAAFVRQSDKSKFAVLSCSNLNLNISKL